MDREFDNRTIGCIIRTDKSLGEKEESVCKIRKGFP